MTSRFEPRWYRGYLIRQEDDGTFTYTNDFAVVKGRADDVKGIYDLIDEDLWELQWRHSE